MDFGICLGVYTDSYHLHVTTLEIAMKTSIGWGLSFKVSIATAVAVVRDIIDGKLLFGIHDCSRKMVQCPGRREKVRRCRERMEHTTPRGGRGAGESYVIIERWERDGGGPGFEVRREEYHGMVVLL